MLWCMARLPKPRVRVVIDVDATGVDKLAMRHIWTLLLQAARGRRVSIHAVGTKFMQSLPRDSKLLRSAYCRSCPTVDATQSELEALLSEDLENEDLLIITRKGGILYGHPC
jgi:hypothetical protein